MNSHGRLLQSELDPKQVLAGVTTWDLAANLLHALRSEQPGSDSYITSQKHLRLFGTLAGELQRRVDVPDNRLAPRSLAGPLGFAHYCHVNHGLPLLGASYLDVGCGSIQPYGRMFAHLMAGAKRVGCLELDPIQDEGEAVRALAQAAASALIDPKSVFGSYPITAREILGNIADFDLARMAKGDAGGINRERLVYLQRSATDTGLPDRFVDVVVSNSVLEHIPDPDATLAELARITRPGGFALHGIDTADHRWYGTPSLHRLEFLTIASNDPIVFGCNRLRPRDFEKIFERQGFDILVRMPGVKIEIPAALRARLQPKWSALPDEQLNETWCQYLLRRR
ncbi:MAG: class I SAM-dependent methyltransferase [Planctomycetes bacterium]|jgi:SAM-dependent methyltransferase|nr:class I SAM-dependent methyltransferase [Planctomycetota bacterium]